jgi:hypothetical protein
MRSEEVQPVTKGALKENDYVLAVEKSTFQW